MADKIPVELQRIVDFLNGQMDRCQVLALEIRQYVGEGSSLKTLVPRVFGQTAEALQKDKAIPRKRRQSDEPSFVADLEERCGRGRRSGSSGDRLGPRAAAPIGVQKRPDVRRLLSNL